MHRETKSISDETTAKPGLKPDELDQSTIDSLVSKNLKEKLEVLAQVDLTNAVHEFVDKDEKVVLPARIDATTQFPL